MSGNTSAQTEETLEVYYVHRRDAYAGDEYDIPGIALSISEEEFSVIDPQAKCYVSMKIGKVTFRWPCGSDPSFTKY